MKRIVAQDCRCEHAWHPLLKLPTVLANARLLATVAGTDGRTPRFGLQAGLQKLQAIPIDRHPNDDAVFCAADPLPGDLEALRELMAVPALPREWHLSVQERRATADKVAAAMALLRDTDEELHAALNVVVGKFLLARLDRYEGGSRTNVVGVIWIGLDARAPVADFAALIVHEYVHQCIFLDDMVRGIFHSGEPELAESAALVVSALRKVPRGYDKAYHSVFVAVALETLYGIWNDRRAGTLMASTRATLRGLQEKPQYVSEHGFRALEQLAEITDRLHAV